MADARTVLDMLVEADLATHIFVASDGINSISVHTDEQAAQRAVDALGVDPDMPYEEWEPIAAVIREHGIGTVVRWLRYGSVVDNTTEDAAGFFHVGTETVDRYDTAADMLDAIKAES